MYLYNSLTRKKDEFVPIDKNEVTMYTCGPTVYHFAHIGNLRSYIMEDVLEKYLAYSGYRVKRAMNITDVGHLTSDADTGEDKMLKGAKREHKTVMEIADFYTKAFFSDCEKLNIKRPEIIAPATGCIDEYIKIITKLLSATDTLILPGAMCILTPQSLTGIMFSTALRKRIWLSVCAKGSRRTRQSAIKAILCSGLPKANLRIRSLSGTAPGE